MRRTFFCLAAAMIWATVPVTCTTPLPVDDPRVALAEPSLGPRKHLGAMLELDADPQDPEYLQELHGLMWRSGYTRDTRQEAFDRLVRHDLQGLKRTIRQRLPRMDPRDWLERLCQLIADNGWTDLSPALVSAWARPIGFVDDLDRVEYIALARLLGPDGVIDEVFAIMVEARKPYEIGLRTRAWSLLLRLGQEQRLRELLAGHTDERQSDDPMLADLAAGVVELGVLPRTREEILWVRALRAPEHRAFWDESVEIVATQPPDRRGTVDVRDLPVLVAAARHRADLLASAPATLRAQLAADLAARTHHINADRFQGFPGVYGQSLQAHGDALTWGDLAAMILAREALDVPQVVEHLFDYAERDRADTSCEYGGVIALDRLGRFEVLEFPPRVRRHDNEFIAPQAMFDSAYTALFHFHMHAQRYRNQKHAGPGLGDVNYADNTRANCLVFTFVSRDTLNVDFYRHGRVIVDLGEVHRP